MCSGRGARALPRAGSPIRRSAGRRLFAPDRGLSQLATSFVDFLCQGIHRVPLVSSSSKIFPMSTWVSYHSRSFTCESHLLISRESKNLDDSKYLYTLCNFQGARAPRGGAPGEPRKPDTAIGIRCKTSFRICSRGGGASLDPAEDSHAVSLERR